MKPIHIFLFIITIWFIIIGFATWFVIIKPFILGMKYADNYLNKINQQ